MSATRQFPHHSLGEELGETLLDRPLFTPLKYCPITLNTVGIFLQFQHSVLPIGNCLISQSFLQPESKNRNVAMSGMPRKDKGAVDDTSLYVLCGM